MSAAPVTRSCGCTGDHLCPTAANLRRRALDLALAEEVEQMAEDSVLADTATRFTGFRRAFVDFRIHTGAGVVKRGGAR